MPSNILRYNQVYKVLVQSSNAKKEFSCVIESLYYEVSQCSSRSQVDSRFSKEQAKVYYQITTSLYTVKPQVKGMVNMCKTRMRYQHVRTEMKTTSKTYVHETMHVNNRMEMKKACLTCVHRRKES